MLELVAVIMAAGKGTRMKSSLPKVLHPLAGKPLIDHVLDCVEQVSINRALVILGHGRERVEEHISGRADIVVQEQQLGTGHAILQALPYLDGVRDVLVMSGDQPLLKPSTVQKLLDLHRSQNAEATVLTAVLPNPYGLGRIIKRDNQLIEIVEEKDATTEQRLIREINTGTYCFNVEALKEELMNISPKNAQGEYYLTDVFKLLLAKNKKVITYCTDDAHEALGINSRGQLAEAEKIVRQRINEHWMEEGVTIIDPSSTFIDAEVELEHDVIIYPFTFLQGKTKVAKGAKIGPHTTLDSCQCGENSEIIYTVARETMIGQHCTIGPFAYLRPGTVLSDKVKVGDFVEIKNSSIGEGSKVPHLSYIGDTEIGNSVNVGAGTITCNYDGKHKHKTIIKDQAFIGSNTNLVAPVVVGENALIGAGSTITKDVPAGALAVERSQQIIKERKHSPKD